MTSEERYEYFIRYCADFETVWGLIVNEDNWIIVKDSRGNEIFPLQPHRDIAEVCLFEEHKERGAKPQSIDLYVFLEKTIVDMSKENIYFGIFINNLREGLMVEGSTVSIDFKDEISSIEEQTNN